MTLANFVTFKAHDSSKVFNNIVVVTIKRILWIRLSTSKIIKSYN